MSNSIASLYIHIPFCRSKCAYCDFLSAAVAGECAPAEDSTSTTHSLITAYSQALLTELRHARTGDYVNTKIDTVYIGGGTPTVLSVSLLCEIVAEARRFNFTPDTEITVECNPGNSIIAREVKTSPPGKCVGYCVNASSDDGELVAREEVSGTAWLACETSTAASSSKPIIPRHRVSVSQYPTHLPGVASHYFTTLRTAGVNRLSIGLQAFQDELLTRIGRTHTATEFLQTFHAARDAGFDNINVDLMFNLPGQTLTDWRESLEKLIELKPEHISAYSLTPAEGTPLWDQLERGELTLPDDETDRAMYHEAERTLTAAGYTRYEISNFALPGRESRHNMNTWQRHPYRGFGLGAHSFEINASNCANNDMSTRDAINGISTRYLNSNSTISDTSTRNTSNGIRWHNTENIEKYIQTWTTPQNKTNLNKHIKTLKTPRNTVKIEETFFLPHLEGIEVLSSAEALSEEIILGLRLTEGIPYTKKIRNRYATEINKLITDGLLYQTNNRIALTPLGTDLANRVMSVFI